MKKYEISEDLLRKSLFDIDAQVEVGRLSRHQQITAYYETQAAAIDPSWRWLCGLNLIFQATKVRRGKRTPQTE